ncbi:MFS transporter [Burkholderia stagnalis]
MVINFADKVVIGIVAVPMMDDMRLSATEVGWVSGAFFLLFAVSGIVIGMLSHRVRAKWLLLSLALSWSVLQFPLAAPVGIGTFIACRILLGVGEGPAYPLALDTAYRWFDDRARNVPTVCIQLGATVGILVSGPVLTQIMQRFSWRACFIALGAAGIVWALAWLLFGVDGQEAGNGGERRGFEPPPRGAGYGPMLRDATVWGTTLLMFCAYGAGALWIAWAPAYMRLGLGIAPAAAGWLYALQIALQIPVGLAISGLSHRMLALGASSRTARGRLACAACVIGGGAYCMLIPDGPIAGKLVAMSVGCAFVASVFSLAPPLVAEIAPNGLRARLLTLTNSLATTAGLVAPAAMGRLIDATGGARHGHYALGFAAIGLLLVAAGTAGWWLVDPGRSLNRAGGAGRLTG